MPNAPGAQPTLGLPLMRWVGGKTRMLPSVVPHFANQTKVVEPFFGGGALSFHLASRRPGLDVVANDRIGAVVDIYEAIRDDVEAFIAGVDSFAAPYLARADKEGRRAYYYDIRRQYMESTIDAPEPLFFLLWCAYSGMFRSGKEFPGRFNTSHGFGNEKPGFYHPERLRATAPLMASWEFTCGDFYDTLSKVTSSTFVFLDPPYRGTYDGYTDEGFTEKDQIRVAKYFKACDKAGAKVVYTNKDLGDSFYAKHFKGFSIERVPIRYSVNRNSATVGRPSSYEVVISNWPSDCDCVRGGLQSTAGGSPRQVHCRRTSMLAH